MNETQIDRSHRTTRSRRRRSTFQRFEELFERELQRHSPDWLLMEEEKLTRLRLALFGCAPK